MKKTLLPLLLTILSTASLTRAAAPVSVNEKTDYINKFLPKNSLIRKAHNEESHGLFFKNKKRSGCNYIKSQLTKIVETEVPRVSGNLSFVTMAFNQMMIKSVIRDILPDQSDKVKSQEYDLLTDAYYKAEQYRKTYLLEKDKEKKEQQDPVS